MEYDEVGQLKQKSLNGEVGSGIQNLNYAYNIRGWLERINNPDVNPSSTSTQKLNLGLYYNNVPSGLSANSQYNGNIAGLVWNTPLQNGALSPADKQGYGFTYDGLNRMTNSAYGEGSTFATNVGANNENLSYDKNGNILTLTRYLKGTGQIDNLTYSYKNSGASNMLDRVDDSVTGTNGFSELVKQANEYGYDGNGNLISDANKGYNSILYNYMNLPKRGTTSQYISYVYDAAGTKLVKVGTGGASTYYAGSFVYSGSSLNYIMHREGMYLPGGNYEYYLKDHLGNTRLVVNTSGTGGTVVQQTDYYPFGMDIATYNGGLDNKYRYNGKEFQDDMINGKNLNWYDYGARFYDPVILRFHTVDPRAEQYTWQSPYCYAANNPIKYIDYNGEGPWETFVFAISHPVAANSIGSVSLGSTNISTNAVRFSTRIGLQENAAHEGSQVNAFRHTLWQATITNRFGTDIAKQVGDAHEDNPKVDLSVKTFTGKDALSKADQSIDLLNNQAGRDIGAANPDATPKELAQKVLDTFNKDGLFTATTNKDGSVSITRTQITNDQYKQASKTINNLNDNGYTQSEQQKKDAEKQK